MPGSFQTSAAGGVPNTRGLPAVRGFMNGDSPSYEYPFAITLTAVDSAGAALASASCVLFRTADNSIAACGVADASGKIRFDASPAITHYLVAYLAGSPDRAGTTVNTLVGA